MSVFSLSLVTRHWSLLLLWATILRPARGQGSIRRYSLSGQLESALNRMAQSDRLAIKGVVSCRVKNPFYRPGRLSWAARSTLPAGAYYRHGWLCSLAACRFTNRLRCAVISHKSLTENADPEEQGSAPARGGSIWYTLAVRKEGPFKCSTGSGTG